MVTLRPYGVQTQASGIAQQNSGGNGYIGNAGMRFLGEALGGAVERGLGIDAESVRAKQQQEINRNAFEAEVERREQERYLQSEKLSGMAKLADLEIDLRADAEDLKAKIPNGGVGYTKALQNVRTKKIGEFIKGLSFAQKEYMQPHIMNFDIKSNSDAYTWERTESINNDLANVGKIQKSLFDTINSNPESVNEARFRHNEMVANLNVEPRVKRKLIEEFDDNIDRIHTDAFVQDDPIGYLNKFSGVKSSFNSVMSYIFKEEGGYVAKDGRSDAPANFGINQKANPDIDVKNLTKEQAQKIYKERYWNAINGDSLPENLRLIAMDTAVNQGVGVAKELIEKSNGDPELFTQLRIEKYKEINQPENEKGWIARANRALESSRGEEVGVLEREGIVKANSLVNEAQKEISNDWFQEAKLAIKNGELNYSDIEDNPNVPADIKNKLSSVQASYDSSIRQAEALKAKKEKEVYNKYIETIKLEVDKGFWDLKKLNATRYDLNASDYDAIKKRIEDKVENEELAKAIYTAPAGSDLQVKAVNNEYKKIESQLFDPAVSPQDKVSVANNFLKQSQGVIPSSLNKTIERMAVSPNANNIEFINGLYQSNKGNRAVIDSLPDKVSTVSSMYQGFIDIGNSPQQALALTNERLNVDEKKIQVRGDEADKFIRKTVSEGGFLSEYGTQNRTLFFFGDDYSDIPKTSDAYSSMESDAKEQYRNYYIQTGDEELAKQKAFDYIGKTYSKFNGEYMKFSPSVVTGFSDDIIDEHFKNNVTDNPDVLKMLAIQNVDASDVSIVGSSKVERAFYTRVMTESGVAFKESPKYFLTVGGLPLFDEQGNVLEYEPNIDELKKIRDAKQEQQESILLNMSLPRG